MKFYEKRTGSREVYNGNIVKVRMDDIELPSGKAATREVIEHPGGVAVLPLDDDQNVYLVRQFRYPFDRELLELPAGKLSPGEDHLECGMRELTEETGFTAGKLDYLGVIYVSPGFTNEVTHLYLARELVPGPPSPDEDEFLDTVKMKFSELVDLILRNEFHDAKSVAGVLKAKVFLGI